MSNFTPRVRFNWGFWDAMADREAGRRAKDEVWLARHFDRSYAAGYSAGKNETGNPATSNDAWRAR